MQKRVPFGTLFCMGIFRLRKNSFALERPLCGLFYTRSNTGIYSIGASTVTVCPPS